MTDPARSVHPLDVRLDGLSTRSQRLLRQVRSAIEEARLQDADAALGRARLGAGKHPEYLRLLGLTRHLQKRRPEALQALRAATEQLPSDALILTNFGSVLRGAGQFIEARAALQRACELAPDFAAAWFNLGRALAAPGEFDAAAEAYERALKCDPGYTQARMGYAELFRAIGRFERAATEYRRVIEQSPRSVRAWESLLSLRGIRLGEQEVTALEQIHAAPDLGSAERIRFGFALGKALDADNRHMQAFTVFNAANAEKRRSIRWDAQAFSRNVDAICTAFDQPPESGADPDAGNDVIFVVGLPHSGSMLVSRILAAHGKVEGSTESADLAHVLNAELRVRSAEFSQWAKSAGVDDWTRLGQAYLQRTRRWHRKGGHLIDASLSNWRFVGAIHAMLPGARIINCRRDPVESCLACYHHLFTRGRAFSYDIPELGCYWRDYDRMLRFWLARYRHRLADVQLQPLCDNPEHEIRRLLANCGLEHDQACLRAVAPASNVRAIGTGAPVRIRGPRDRALDYAPLLLPLRAALGADMDAVISQLKRTAKALPSGTRS